LSINDNTILLPTPIDVYQLGAHKPERQFLLEKPDKILKKTRCFELRNEVHIGIGEEGVPERGVPKRQKFEKGRRFCEQQAEQ
jgi:hypothetical protein